MVPRFIWGGCHQHLYMLLQKQQGVLTLWDMVSQNVAILKQNLSWLQCLCFYRLKKKKEIPSSCILPFHKPSVDLALLVHQHWWVKMGQELSAHRTAWRLRSYVGGLSLLFCSRTLVHNTFNKILTTGSKVFELLLGFLFYFSLGQLLVHFMWNAVLTEITGNFDTNIKGSKCHNLTTAHKEAKSLASEIHSETISANAGLRLWFALESYCVPTELFYSKFSGAAIPYMF